MKILDTLRAEREKLDAKVNAAIAERDAFIASISDAVGQSQTNHRRGNRRPMSAEQRQKLSAAKKEYWKNRKTAKK